MATNLVVGGNRHGQRQSVPHGRRVTMPKSKPASILRASAPHQAQRIRRVRHPHVLSLEGDALVLKRLDDE
jgi:hypothetical protein